MSSKQRGQMHTIIIRILLNFQVKRSGSKHSRYINYYMKH